MQYYLLCILRMVSIVLSAVWFGSRTLTVIAQTLNQTSHTNAINRTQLKKLFHALNQNNEQSTWNACYSSDSAYLKEDTLILSNDPNAYMRNRLCFVTQWTFTANHTFNLCETHVCQEPPPTRISFENIGLTLRYSNKKGICKIYVVRKRKRIDAFQVLALQTLSQGTGASEYVLILKRIDHKKTLIAS